MSAALPVVAAEIVEPSVRLIAEASAQRFGVSYRELLSARRTGPLVLPRHIAMYLATKHTRRSLPEIGRLMGGRDHTTVLHARRKIEALRAEPAVAAAISEIELAIDAGTLMIERQSRPVMIDVDPFEASRKILDQDACRVSVDDVRAMASFIRASCAPLVERDSPEAVIADLVAALPVRAPHAVMSTATEVVAAWKRLQTAEFTIGERQARAALGAAMEALSIALEHETKRRP